MTADTFINRINAWDQKLILKFNGIGGKPFTYFLKFISFFGRETIWFFILATYLFIWYDPVIFIYIGTSFMCGLILIVPIKEIVNRERPFKTIQNIKILEPEPVSKSFPSWHAYNVVAQGFTIGFLLKSPMIIVFMLLFAGLVAFSRIQLGVHYPSDVITGYLLGIIGFLLTILILAPLFIWILPYVEQLAIYDIQYQQINSMIFEEIWYITLCIAVFGGIFLSSTFKFIQERLIKRQ